MSEVRYTPGSMNELWQRRAAALLEVLGVFLAGQFVAQILALQLERRFAMSFPNPLRTLSAHSTNAELIPASPQMFVLLMFQYAGYFLLIIPINWWYRR